MAQATDESIALLPLAQQQKVNVAATFTSAVVGVQHNDGTVGSEATFDFEDGSNVTWTLTDDAPNGRVKVAASVPSQHTYSSEGSSFPGSPSAGDTFWLVSGNTTIPFVYDGTHWYSDIQSAQLLADGGVTQTDVSSAAYIGPTTGGSPFLDTNDTGAAGCLLQLRAIALMQGSSGKQAHVELATDGASLVAGTAIATTTGGSASEVIAGAWTDVNVGTYFGRILAYGWRDSGGSGISVTFSNVTAQWRFKK